VQYAKWLLEVRQMAYFLIRWNFVLGIVQFDPELLPCKTHVRKEYICIPLIVS
jgi:hypothetical protein